VGLGHLVGTPLLRAFMHGFFLHNRLWHKAAALAAPFAYDDYRAARVAAKLEAERQSRITVVRKLPKARARRARRSQSCPVLGARRAARFRCARSGAGGPAARGSRRTARHGRAQRRGREAASGCNLTAVSRIGAGQRGSGGQAPVGARGRGARGRARARGGRRQRRRGAGRARVVGRGGGRARRRRRGGPRAQAAARCREQRAAGGRALRRHVHRYGVRNRRAVRGIQGAAPQRRRVPHRRPGRETEHPVQSCLQRSLKEGCQFRHRATSLLIKVALW